MKSTKAILRMIKAERRLMKAEMESVRRAVDKVEATNSAKFEAQNEWRQSMKDRESKYLTRNEVWAIAVAVAGILLAVYLNK